MIDLILVLLVLCVAATGKLNYVPNSTEESNATFPPNTNMIRSPPITHSLIYSYIETGNNVSLPFSWVDVEVSVADSQVHAKLLESLLPTPRLPGNVSASFFVAQPVYISLTTMASRLDNVTTTVLGLVQARIVPDRIYLLLSKEPYLLDTGVTHIPDNLLCLAAAGYLNLVFTSNLGPHRKLLPVLHKYWSKDVFIATVDDDMSRAQGYTILYQLLKTYVQNNRTHSVVALRTRRISVCNTPPYRATKYFSWPVVMSYNRTEMLLMPTGTGGILYKPAYFHKAVFLQSFRYATGTADDLMFRLATMMNDVPVTLGCSAMYYRGQKARTCKYDSFDRLYDSTYGSASSALYTTLQAEALLESRRAYLATLSTAVANAKTSPPPPTNAVATANPEQQKARTPLSSTSKDLFSINRRGGNDHAWRLALTVLQSQQFWFENVTQSFVREREEFCFAPNRTVRVERYCGMFDCKGKSNSRVVTK